MNSVQENKNELEAAVRYCESAISRAKATIESMEFRQQAASQAWREQTGREESLLKKLEVMTDKYDRMKGYADQLLDENGTMEADLDASVAEVTDLKIKYNEAKTNMALMTDENLELEERNDKLNAQIVEQTGREAALEREVTRLKGIIAEGNNIIDEGKEDRETLVKKVAELKTQLVEWRDRSMQYTNEIATLNDQLAELSKAYKDSTNEEITMKKAWREQREIVALRDDQIAMLERRLAKYTGEKSYPFKEGDLYYVFNQLDGTWIESVWDDESERIHDTPSLPNHPHKVYFTIDQKNVLDKFKPEDE